MEKELKLEERVWWDYLEEDLQELLKTAARLVDEVEEWKVEFHDYSFVVFPASKAYEGFLKKFFLDLDFITEKAYWGTRFRVGKSLNPSLPKRLRDRNYVYDDLVEYCGGDALAKKLWKTWKSCRNVLFHWFPKEKKVVDFEEAQKKLKRVVDSIDQAFKECELDKKKIHAREEK